MVKYLKNGWGESLKSERWLQKWSFNPRLDYQVAKANCRENLSGLQRTQWDADEWAHSYVEMERRTKMWRACQDGDQRVPRSQLKSEKVSLMFS